MHRYRLEIREGEDHRTVHLSESAPVTIGRHGDNRVVLGHPLVSSHHAEIDLTEDGPRVRDLDSKNGTWVNGERIEEPLALAPHDVVVVGGVSLRIYLDSLPEETSVTFDEGEPERTQVFATIDTRLTAGAERDAFQYMKSASRNLAVIHALGDLLLEARTEAALLDGILDLVFEVLQAERAAIFLVGEDGRLDPGRTRARTHGREALTVSRTILNRTVEEGLSLLTSDAVVDERFRSGHSVIMQGIRSALCAPVRGRRDVIGAVYVDTRMQRGAFRSEDLELVTMLGLQGGVALENLRLVRQNLENERLAAIGGVMAGLSHDIRNILTTLRGGAFVMDQVVGRADSEDLREAWSIVRAGTDTITVLVEDMISYSKVREPEKDPNELNPLVAMAVERFANRAGEQGSVLRTELEEGLGEVAVDPPSIDRVLTNLLGNALDALEQQGGEVVVATRRLGEDEVEISVRDDGPGIPLEHRDRIFDLLFSTKGSKGTGFGLAITRKIVSEHDGTVDFESEVGAGTTFRVRLPRS